MFRLIVMIFSKIAAKKLEFQNPTSVSSIETNGYVLSSIEIRELICSEFQSLVFTNFIHCFDHS
jgi:hypothetical protein